MSESQVRAWHVTVSVVFCTCNLTACIHLLFLFLLSVQWRRYRNSGQGYRAGVCSSYPQRRGLPRRYVVQSFGTERERERERKQGTTDLTCQGKLAVGSKLTVYFLAACVYGRCDPVSARRCQGSGGERSNCGNCRECHLLLPQYFERERGDSQRCYRCWPHRRHQHQPHRGSCRRECLRLLAQHNASRCALDKLLPRRTELEAEMNYERLYANVGSNKSRAGK
jgi:hypothetical protein